MNEEQNENQPPEKETPINGLKGTRPTIKFSGSGGVVVSVWKSKNEAGYDNYSVVIDRNYKKADDKFDATPYLRDSDLLRVQKLLGEADAWIEQEKAKGRRASASTNAESAAR